MRRFIISAADVNGDRATITGDLFHHMAHVLRLKNGTRVCLANGGNEYIGVIRNIDGESISVALEESHQARLADGPAITLFQGLPRGDKLEFIIQKATELGAAGIVPFAAARSVARVPAGRLEEKQERWRRIAREAARQSNGFSVPDISFVGDLAETLHQADQPVKLLFWEEAEPGTLKKALAGIGMPERLAVIIGPEGGFTQEEAALAVKCGALPVSLGRRIVRTETAGLAILAILRFHWGGIG